MNRTLRSICWGCFITLIFFGSVTLMAFSTWAGYKVGLYFTESDFGSFMGGLAGFVTPIIFLVSTAIHWEDNR